MRITILLTGQLSTMDISKNKVIEFICYDQLSKQTEK